MPARAIRVPNLSDLSDPAQVRDLSSTLRSIRTELSRTSMPVEEVRSSDVTTPEGTRFRVVERSVAPDDAGFDVNQKFEVHFFVGGKWMRVMLEEL